jgi:hypothetical protein
LVVALVETPWREALSTAYAGQHEACRYDGIVRIEEEQLMG